MFDCQHVACLRESIHLPLQIVASPERVAQFFLDFNKALPRLLQRSIGFTPAQTFNFNTTFQFAFSLHAGVARPLQFVHTAPPLLVSASHGIVKLNSKLLALAHLNGVRCN